MSSHIQLSSTYTDSDIGSKHTLTPTSIELSSFAPPYAPSSNGRAGDLSLPSINAVAPFAKFSSAPIDKPGLASQEELAEAPRSSSSRRAAVWDPRTWPWSRIESIFWAALPLLFHIIGSLVLLVAMIETFKPYMSVVQLGQGATGRLDYGLLDSCAIAPGTTKRICTSPQVNVDFVPSLLLVSESMPGFTALKLLFVSQQTPAIMLSCLILLWVSLIVYIPLWVLAYFPHRNSLPQVLTRFYRFYAKRMFIFVFALAFPALVLTLTISLGYHLLIEGNVMDFNNNMLAAVEAGLTGGSITAWKAEVGDGFNLLWTSCAFQAANVIAINVAMHNGLHEIVEWPEMQQTKIFW